MSYLMGIDLGTQSVRVLLMNQDGYILSLANETYDISIPQPFYAEQDPEIWFQKTVLAIRKVLSECSIHPDEISALSFSGQMHGMVCVDESGQPLHPAIIWLDQRATNEIKEIYQIFGRDFIEEQVQNTITPGFLIGTLYWIFKKKPRLYQRISKVMFAKDYIKYRLCGSIITDYSDAAGSGGFNNISLCWAEPLITALGLDINILPQCKPSTEVVGNITKEAAELTGLSRKTIIVNGGADQCMQAIGNGIINEGIFSCNIGTGGQISTCSSQPVFDKKLRTNTFAHVIDGKWNIMGACLSSGVSLKWLANSIISQPDFSVIDIEAEKLPVGSNGLIFLPYLSGERTPHLDPLAKGVFCGLTMQHNKYHLARAVMEGVTFSLKDALMLVLEMGIPCKRIIAGGGGANSKFWLQMQADILEQPVYKSLMSEQACFGAAITAGVGCKIYPDFSFACDELVKIDSLPYEPIKEHVKLYREYYEIFRELYPANKKCFEKLSKVNGIF